MKDTRKTIFKALRDMDKAFHLYENGEDTLPVAKRLLRVRHMMAKATSALIWERVDATLAKSALNRKDTESLQELLRLKQRSQD